MAEVLPAGDRYARLCKLQHYGTAVRDKHMRDKQLRQSDDLDLGS